VIDKGVNLHLKSVETPFKKEAYATNSKKIREVGPHNPTLRFHTTASTLCAGNQENTTHRASHTQLDLLEASLAQDLSPLRQHAFLLCYQLGT